MKKYALALRQAQSKFKIYTAARKAHQAGDIQMAGLLYTRVALSRYALADHKTAAKSALQELKTEAREKFNDVEQRLWMNSIPSGDSLADFNASDTLNERIVSAFEELEQLIRDYRTVPVVDKELSRSLKKLKSEPVFAAVLNQPMAAELWQRGQQHEQADEICCAFLTYQEAVKFLPAPAAVTAESRLAALSADRQILASALRCEKIRQCQQLYDRATRLTKSWVAVDRAKFLFGRVVSEAPEGSAVRLAARQQLAGLN